jgi:hypothetical protein
MARKPITEQTQNAIFIKCRRRCCLCFWLEGKDEVVKGQLAHLDQDHENNNEDNLAFLCLLHHDEYDSRPSQSKGLREHEVRKWRNELYREMEYRFRTILKHGCEVRFKHFALTRNPQEFGCYLVLKNTGETAVRRPTVTIRLLDNVRGTYKKPKQEASIRNFNLMPILDEEAFEFNSADESRLDVFEPNGRVVVWSMHWNHPVLMPNHICEFKAIAFQLDKVMVDNCLELDYRVDYEEGTPSVGTQTIRKAAKLTELILLTDSGSGLPSEEEAEQICKGLKANSQTT